MAISVTKSRRCLVPTSAEVVTLLDKNRSYVVYHMGVGSDGTTAVTGNIYLDTAGGTATVDNTAGEGLHTVLSGSSYPIPAGTETFSWIATATATLVQIIGSESSGSPTSPR